MKVCKELGEEWKPLARALGLSGLARSNAPIEEIEKRCPTKLSEQAHLCLQQWRKEQGQKATFSNLIRALQSCELNQIAGE